MKPKLTLEQQIERDAADLARKREKLAARKARIDSATVRKLETTLRAVRQFEAVTTAEISAHTAMSNVLMARLQAARAEAYHVKESTS